MPDSRAKAHVFEISFWVNLSNGTYASNADAVLAGEGFMADHEHVFGESACSWDAENAICSAGKTVLRGTEPHAGINEDLQVSHPSLVWYRPASYLPARFRKYQRSYQLALASAPTHLLARPRPGEPRERSLSKCVGHPPTGSGWFWSPERYE